ncbi:FAD-dependent oxidoreductase [Alkalibaculum bacchi]|uniref:FAD-dependent oxidoreductase n=1 Tax=Alkalibaculum bacchi TaxID=645887 RepID=UPI00350E39C2
MLATGSVPNRLPIKGLENNNKVVNAEDILLGKVIPGKHNVVIGGGQVGAETAHFLTQLLRNVTVLEMQDTIASDAYLSIQWALVESLEKRHVSRILNCSLSNRQVKKQKIVY